MKAMYKRILAAWLLAVLLILPLPAPALEQAGPEKAGAAEGIQVLVDDEILPLPAEMQEDADKAPGLWVTLTVDGVILLELPFEEAHTVRVIQDGIGENTIVLTGEQVYMEKADCPGHDCVQMGEVTRENLELRVLGGFIICLPHRLAVEVWEKK